MNTTNMADYQENKCLGRLNKGIRINTNPNEEVPLDYINEASLFFSGKEVWNHVVAQGIILYESSGINAETKEGNPKAILLRKIDRNVWMMVDSNRNLQAFIDTPKGTFRITKDFSPVDIRPTSTGWAYKNADERGIHSMVRIGLTSFKDKKTGEVLEYDNHVAGMMQKARSA